MKKQKNKTKTKYVDDGHTVYDMSGLSDKGIGRDKNDGIGLSGKEKWAAIKAAVICYLPALIIALAGFGAAMLIIYFWLMF